MRRVLHTELGGNPPSGEALQAHVHQVDDVFARSFHASEGVTELSGKNILDLTRI